ncbi:hypothetical protein J437_LFUL018859 [Ladona fulva]|uniref:Nucleic-acid-binding protein from mobile element jockey n=1 Tax=Ladona fulva TaxID=123851 RepID=A0A8K0KVR9_LADFU|nr:hypothetical protein J437_LFUL018859 [Ladona fulva]
MCHRCNRFGHSSEHCYSVPRCFRCAGPHLIAECQLTKEDEPTCCNCGGAHAAVSRACSYRKQVRARRITSTEITASPATTFTEKPLPRPTVPQQRNAWKNNSSLTFITPQVQQAAPPRRLNVDIPKESVYRATTTS